MLIAHAIPRAASNDTELLKFYIFTRWLSGYIGSTPGAQTGSAFK